MGDMERFIETAAAAFAEGGRQFAAHMKALGYDLDRPAPEEPMTTREKLIEAASRAAMYSEVVTPDHGDVARVDNWPEVIDAILDTLREPSPEMIAAGMAHEDTDLASEWRAMIDHVRSGK